MATQIYSEGNVLIAKPACEIDHHSAERLRGQVDAAFDKSSCRHIIFDFSGVTFMDSSGIGMIIGRYKNAEKRGGRLALAAMSDEMGRLFQISGLAKIITRTATVEEALLDLSGPKINASPQWHKENSVRMAQDTPHGSGRISS